MTDDRSPTEDAPGPDDSDEEEIRRTLYRHPLNAVGGALILSGSFAFVILTVLDLTTGTENPYRSLITFVGAPVIVLIGLVLFLIGVRVQIGNARARGERVRFNLRIEPTDPRFRRSLWIFLGLSLSLVGIVAYSGVQGFEATDSVTFCADACHAPMEPQSVAHQESAHARVACVECHIGPGGTSWLRAKVDGIRQLWGVMTDAYNKPIPAPVAHMQSAEAVCEDCHWSEDFKGQKFITATHYGTDEANTPWTVDLLINVGGGPEGGVQEGIHWHMFESTAMEYIATDEERQDIAWVKVTNRDGTTEVYKDPDGAPDPSDPEVEVRTFDCMDCHNRPSHVMQSSGALLDLEMSRGLINPDLPYVKATGLRLLDAPYATKAEGVAAIREGLINFYETDYPQQASTLRADIEQAADQLVDIYEKNFFPEMNTDYRVRYNNASHFTNAGCFRCHFSDLETDTGVRVSATCETCHLIVAQGRSDDPSDLATDLSGLEFQHPVDIGEAWRNIPCTQCHSPYSGY